MSPRARQNGCAGVVSGRSGSFAKPWKASASAWKRSSAGTRAEGFQLVIEFSEEEKRQRQADVASWRTRLAQFDRDLETEPDRIRAFYEVRAKRGGADRAGLSLAGHGVRSVSAHACMRRRVAAVTPAVLLAVRELFR